MHYRKPSPIEVTREAFETMKSQAGAEFQAIQNRFGDILKTQQQAMDDSIVYVDK